MANDTLPMPVIFKACDDILNKSIRPYYYKELTELALESIGVSINSVNITKQYEDVREKYCYRPGVKYIPNPDCLIYLDKWISKLNLINPFDPYFLPCDIKDAYKANFEGLMRSEHMENKHNIDIASRMKKRAKGLLIEHHVSGWYRRQWPLLFKEPNNKDIYNMACSHDLTVSRLKIFTSWQTLTSCTMELL
jgi:hypothetical protein